MCSNAAEVKESVLHTVRRDPEQFGIQRSRWRLCDVLSTCEWLGITTTSGIWRLFDRFGICLKWGRDHIHSPDPDYDEKLAHIKRLRKDANDSGGRIALWYLDEFTYYRQPLVAQAYELSGKDQPLAQRSYQSDTATRVVGALNPVDGRVIHLQSSKAGISEMVALYRKLRESCPDAQKIYAVQDNWPVHFHPDILVALEEQKSKWPFRLPPNWSTKPTPKAVRKWGDLNLPIQIVQLPTYASWTNPIEKLWRWLKQTVLYFHRYADDLQQLRYKVSLFFDQFINGSKELIHYVGCDLPY